MTRERFFDRWSPETPVKVTWANDEPDAFLSLADAGRRLGRFDADLSEAAIRRHLAAGNRFVTPFATYQLVTEVTA